jgi:phytoene dehydrogenase-like protein
VVAKNFYDVIVIGTQLGPLLSAALLARRGFRVLLLGHDDLLPTYHWNRHHLNQEPFLLAGAETPAVRRILSELSLTQIFRQRSFRPDPAFQVVLPDHRLDFTSDGELFSREIEREFPEAQRAISAFYSAMDRCNVELDKMLGADLVLPPETFFERRDVTRAAMHNPFSRTRGPVPLFGDLPRHHPFRLAVEAQVRWSTHLDLPDEAPLALVRLHASWFRTSKAFDGGLAGFKALLRDRISTHSGDVRPDLRADRVAVRRGRVAGVRMAGQDEVTGCNFVIVGAESGELPRLVDVEQLGRKFNLSRAQVRPAWYRYTLNLVVEADVIPEGMASHVLFVSDTDQPLSEENCLHLEVTGASNDATRTLCVGALLPAADCRDEAYVASLRERIMERMRWLVPFLDRHLLAIDSPHDGRPLQDLVNDKEVTLGNPWQRHPRHMAEVCLMDQPGPLGVTGLPHRTGLKNLLLASRHVAPGLGLEGEFLTAWGAADIVTRSDRRKKKFRRETWANIDL